MDYYNKINMYKRKKEDNKPNEQLLKKIELYLSKKEEIKKDE